MKAYIIKSTEYKHNEPSVFVFVNGEYFGDLVYPTRDKMPQDINHWRTATCADSDRWFSVTETEITDEQVTELRRLHKELDENSKHFVPYTSYQHGLSYQEREADRQENLRREEINRQYYRKAIELREAVDEIVSSLNSQQKIDVHGMRYITLNEIGDHAKPYIDSCLFTVAYRGEVSYDERKGVWSYNSQGKISDEIIGYYGIVTAKDGKSYTKFWSVEHAQEEAAKHSSEYINNRGMYYTQFNTMTLKRIKSILLLELLLDIKAQ